MNLTYNFLNCLPLSIYPSCKLFKNQKHDYRCLNSGIDYVFEPINTGIKGYMTGVGEGVKSGDWIILEYQKQTFSYQVKEIDYYSSPANMWTALLQVIS